LYSADVNKQKIDYKDLLFTTLLIHWVEFLKTLSSSSSSLVYAYAIELKLNVKPTSSLKLKKLFPLHLQVLKGYHTKMIFRKS